MATLIAGKFSVVTTLVALGAGNRAQSRAATASPAACARVRASDVPVLELEVPGLRRPRTHLGGDRARASSDDRAEAIVLGCAGMADLAAELAASTAFPSSTASPARSSFAKASSDLALRPPSEADTRFRAANLSPGYSHPSRQPAASATRSRAARHRRGDSAANRRECSRMPAKLLTFPSRMSDVRTLAEARYMPPRPADPAVGTTKTMNILGPTTQDDSDKPAMRWFPVYAGLRDAIVSHRLAPEQSFRRTSSRRSIRSAAPSSGRRCRRCRTIVWRGWSRTGAHSSPSRPNRKHVKCSRRAR